VRYIVHVYMGLGLLGGNKKFPHSTKRTQECERRDHEACTGAHHGAVLPTSRVFHPGHSVWIHSTENKKKFGWDSAANFQRTTQVAPVNRGNAPPHGMLRPRPAPAQAALPLAVRERGPYTDRPKPLHRRARRVDQVTAHPAQATH
jgi:hypothetical protein